MKWHLLLLAVLLLALITDVTGDKTRKHKKYRRHRTTTTTTESELDGPFDTDPNDAEKDLIEMLEEDEKVLKKLHDEKINLENTQEIRNNEVVPKDPCVKKHCKAGEVCQVDVDGNAECVCISSCPEEIDPRRKVCSNFNETWESDCELHQMRCWCHKDLPQCRGDDFKHIHIEYYGACKEMPECSSEEMADFPRRMRDWLFNIMRDLAERQELSAYYLKMEREAESNLTRRWTNAAIWKWCDLDGSPHDRSVSRHELFPIRAPLLSLEHCIGPFLDSCDVDDDHRISLKEWGKCLELDEDDLDEKCDELVE